MEDSLILRYQLLQDYLRTVHENFPEDLLNDLEDKEPEYVQHIRNSESEYRRLGKAIHNREYQQAEEEQTTFSPQAEMVEQLLPLDPNSSITDAYPPRPKQTYRQAANGSTMFTRPETLVSPGYTAPCRGMNWPHIENILKLYAISFFIVGTPTEQQKEDIEELSKAVRSGDDARAKRTNPTTKTAQEIISGEKRVYVKYGKDIIWALAGYERALAEHNEEAERFYSDELKARNAEITNSYIQQDANQRRKVSEKANKIFELLGKRYRVKE